MSTLLPLRFAWYLVAADGWLLYLVAPILTSFLQSAVLACSCLPPSGRIARKAPRVGTRLPWITTGGMAIVGFFSSADSDLYKS